MPERLILIKICYYCIGHILILKKLKHGFHQIQFQKYHTFKKKQKGHCLTLWSTRDPIRSPMSLKRKIFLSGKILKWCQTVPFTLVLSKQFWQVQVCSTCIFKKKVIISLQKCFEMTLISVKYFFFRFRSTEYLNQCIILRVGFFFQKKVWKFWVSFCWVLKNWKIWQCFLG